MIYAYVRVSTEKQTVENQRFEIIQFSQEKELVIDQWVMETVSGLTKINERKFGPLLKRMKPGDLLLVTELSRLGRNLMQIMHILLFCMEHNIRVYTAKERYELGDNINSKVLAFAFGLSAEIERNLISQRTKEALARKRAEGIVLGRPKGSRNKSFKLQHQSEKINNMRNNNASFYALAKRFKVHPMTIQALLRRESSAHRHLPPDILPEK